MPMKENSGNAKQLTIYNVLYFYYQIQATLVTKSRLLKYFKIDELPEELGGTLAFNHEQWLKNRIVSEWICCMSNMNIGQHLNFNIQYFYRFQRIEDFRKSFNKVVNDLDAFKESLQARKSIRPSETDETYKCHAGNQQELQNIIKLTIKNGKRISTLTFNLIFISTESYSIRDNISCNSIELLAAIDVFRHSHQTIYTNNLLIFIKVKLVKRTTYE